MSKIENPGRYKATATQADVGEAQTGTPYVFINFAAEAGDIGAYLYLSEKALPNTVKTLQKAFGFDSNFETLADQIVNKECDITVEYEENDKGEERLKVKWINVPRVEMADKSSFLKGLTQKAARIPKDAPRVGSAPARKTEKAADPF